MLNRVPLVLASRLMVRSWPRQARNLIRSASASGVTLLVGCMGSTEPSQSPSLVRISPEWVTSEVAQHIGPDGFFREISATPEFPWELDKAAITPIVTGFVRTFIPVREFLERDHGASIRFDRLTPCGRTLYFESSFEPLMVSNPVMPPNLQWLGNGIDAGWLLRYCDGDTRIVWITILARTGLRLNTDGTVDFSVPNAKGANEVSFVGIPLGRSNFFPEPEEAVQTIFRGTGQRISEVPQPVQNPILVEGANASGRGYFWRIRTENEVQGRRESDGAPVTAREFYVSLNTSPDSGHVLVADSVPLPLFWFKTGAFPSDSALMVPRWSMNLHRFIRDN